MFKILVTCPPMIKQINNYDSEFKRLNLDYYCPKFTQTMTEDELIKILPNYDGWIIGDDPATRKVFEAGKAGKLRAAVKWGVGVDNVDFIACKDLGIPITNVPGVFGEEVSDVALGYLLCLTRKLHVIDIEVKNGNWVKPCGNSLTGKKVCLVGFGDIGRCTARKLLAFNLDVHVSDPGFSLVDNKIVCNYNPDIIVDEYLQKVHLGALEECITNCDYIITTCNLNKFTYHLINKNNIIMANKGVKVINVARGPIVKEDDVLELLEEGHIESVGFDVFEHEPLSINNKLRNYSGNIFGSHNGSNTIEAVNKVSYFAINKIDEYLNL
jgi:D-3-phosphoglycerate dehydrogenase